MRPLRLFGGAVVLALLAAHGSAAGAPRIDFARRAHERASAGTVGQSLAAQERDGPAQPERITFGFLPQTMRWTNRPTFQQVITFDGHRP